VLPVADVSPVLPPGFSPAGFQNGLAGETGETMK
jgi:hypothetical protein